MYKCVLLIREDITMSTGKMIAQCGHGIAQSIKGSNKKIIREWMRNGEKIVSVKVKNLTEMEDIKKRSNKAGIYSKIIYDAGLTEVDPDTPTICVVGPDLESKISPFTNHLRLL